MGKGKNTFIYILQIAHSVVTGYSLDDWDLISGRDHDSFYVHHVQTISDVSSVSYANRI